LKLFITIIFLTLTINSQTYNKPTNDNSRERVVKASSVRSTNARGFSATAYCLSKNRMANGQKVHHGAIAADPRVLPLGTKVRIEGMGVFTVKDTGGAIRGKRIDIWMSSCQAAKNFGRRNILILPLDNGTIL
jgi:3D (Asp-Asp-Asp) domain-containing protein